MPCESPRQQLDAAVAPGDVPGPAFGVAAAEVGEPPADAADTRKRGPGHDVAVAGGDAKVAAPLVEIQPAAGERQASIKREEEEMKLASDDEDRSLQRKELEECQNPTKNKECCIIMLKTL